MRRGHPEPASLAPKGACSVRLGTVVPTRAEVARANGGRRQFGGIRRPAPIGPSRVGEAGHGKGVPGSVQNAFGRFRLCKGPIGTPRSVQIHPLVVRSTSRDRRVGALEPSVFSRLPKPSPAALDVDAERREGRVRERRARGSQSLRKSGEGGGRSNSVRVVERTTVAFVRTSTEETRNHLVIDSSNSASRGPCEVRQRSYSMLQSATRRSEFGGTRRFDSRADGSSHPVEICVTRLYILGGSITCVRTLRCQRTQTRRYVAETRYEEKACADEEKKQAEPSAGADSNPSADDGIGEKATLE